MTKARNLTAPARDGYTGTANPYLYTSPNYYAHALGAYMLASGRTAPRDVRMGRGDSIRANDMRFSIKHAPKDAPPAVSFERIE
jgi:hypothetical protein